MHTAILLKRYKRFLADVQLADGTVITIHCPNTGSMKNCAEPGSKIWYSTSTNTKRKYANTWELVETSAGEMIGVNTIKANHLVRKAIGSGVVAELSGYDRVQNEVRYGNENSRIDFLLSKESAANPGTTDAKNESPRNCYVEVKNVSLLEQSLGEGVGLFPDSVSVRGTRHLRELINVVESGDRAVLFFCVQHTGISEVRPADQIDPDYARTLRQARDMGVEIIAYVAEFNPPDVFLTKRIPVICH